MSKKIVAMLMAVAMAFSLLPVTAFATGGTQEGNSQTPVTVKKSENNLTMTKTVKPVPNQDGTYTVRLESYATGSVTTTQAPVPMDFVLVLDVSGSMDGENGQIASYGYQETKKTSWYAENVYYAITTYYAKIGEEYYPVSCQRERVPNEYIGSHYEYWLEANGRPLGNKGRWNDKLYNGSLYIYGELQDSRMSKLAAMKTAVNNFIESVAAQKNGNTPVAHRISIVKFAGKSNDGVGNDTYKEVGNTYNYTQKVTELTDITVEGKVDSLKTVVNALTAGGATRADLGMEKADGVLNGRQDAEKDRPSVVIMFTDGKPTTSDGFEWNVAGAAVDTAKTLKDKSTKVYTIGMFTDADPSDTDGAFNKYMNGVSSKYPDAVGTKKNNKKDYNGIYLGTRVDGNYYFKADNAGDLEQVFQTISHVTTTTSPLDASAVVVDNVPSNFALTEGSVKVYTADCTGKTGEELNWDTATPAQGISSTSTKNDDGSQTISTTGFNFSRNWCGVDGDTHRGQKLIIEFTISRTNYGGTQPTNAGAYIKANADSTDRIIWVDDPEVPVTVKLPEGSDPYTDTKVYDGAGFDIKNEIGKIVAGLVPVNRINNKFIDLTYEIKDSSENTVGTYTIPAGQTAGTWSADSTEIKTGSNVGDYKYKITVTGQDKKQPSNKNSKTCEATFTITQKEVTFTGESKSVPWNGDEQTITGIIAPTDLVTGHTYEDGLTYVAKGTDTGSYGGKFTGTAIIKDADGNNVTANYDVKTEPGTLTIIDNTREVTVTFNVVGGKWSDGKTEHSAKVTLTNGKGSLNGADIPTGSPSGGHTGPGAWSNDANITGDPVNGMEITQNTVFTLTYPESKPVESEVNVTFKIVGGKWSDGTTEDIKRVVKLTDGTGSLAGVTIPTGSPSDGYTGSGVWINDAGINGDPVNATEITKDTTFTLTFQEKEEQKPSDPVELDVSRSKIASDDLTKNSNGDWTTNVTLSLPSAEYKPVIDVVFILDDSHAGNEIFKDAATSLLTELSQKENVDVNVGIVNFDAVARDWVAATTNSQYSGLISVKNAEGLQALNTAIATKLAYENDGQTKKVGATNIEWPLEMAQNMLASGKGTEKYAILFSDMYGYVYRGDLKIGETTYENVPLSKRYFSTGGSLSMGTKYTNFADVYAHRNDEENQTLDGFFRDSSWDNYWGIYSGYTPIPTNPVTADNDPFHVSGGYSGFEKSTCLVYDRLLQMKKAGINLSIVNNDFTFTEGQYIQPIKNGMLDKLGKQGICIIKTQENPTADEVKSVFATLKDQLIQVVSAGSTVTDKIGTQFDFVGLDTMTLKIGGEKMVGTIDKTTNTITFKHGDKNDAHVVAYDSDANSFQWTINEDVTKDARVQLTYTVKLKTPQTLAGTYGVKDLNGDGIVDGTESTKVVDGDALYTNQSATMVPKDSNGNTGKELTFPKPSVSYTIKSSSGSHSGGSRPSLNTKDHYGYIIGYPVDYYTGQPTTDQTKKPVRPEGKITRAEVATIYFRMLTDESRTKFWSQSNAYSDVKTGDWFNNAVSTLSNAGIIAGYEDGSFRPNGYITRAEFATIAARFFDVTYNGKDLFPDISGHWAKDYINQAANKGFVNGYEDGTFKPDRNITRAEAVTLVNRTLDRHPDKNHFTKDMLVWPDNMDQTKWYYADMQEATNSHTYQMKENSDKTKYENWTKTLPIRNWEALEKAWSNANSSQGNGNVV